jgi:hypothetical protein
MFPAGSPGAGKALAFVHVKPHAASPGTALQQAMVNAPRRDG